MKDSTKLFREHLELQSENLSESEKKRIDYFKDLLNNISDRNDLSKNEKLFQRLFFKYYIGYLSFDHEVWMQIGMGYKVFTLIFSEMKFFHTINDEILSMSQSSRIKRLDKFSLKIRFLICDFIENFDEYLEKIPIDSINNESYTKQDYIDAFENYETSIEMEIEEIKSMSVNIGQKSRKKLNYDYGLREFFLNRIEEARILFGSFETISKVSNNKINLREEIKNNIKSISKHRKSIFQGIYDDIELKEKNTKNEKKVFLYDLFTLIYHHLPRTEEIYQKVKDKDSEQSFRDYKIEAVRNLAG